MALGDYLDFNLTSSGALSLPNNSPVTSILSISLPPEDWDVQGNIVFLPTSGSPTQTEFHVSPSLLSSALDVASPNNGGTHAMHPQCIANDAMVIPSGRRRYNFRGNSSNTTVYLLAIATWTSSSATMEAYGYIGARSFG